MKTAEQFWKNQNRRNMQDKHDRALQQFDYYDMIDFAEQYAREHAIEVATLIYTDPFGEKWTIEQMRKWYDNYDE